MKKILTLFLSVFLLIGCTTQKTKEDDQQFGSYDKIKQDLIQRRQFDTDATFDVVLLYNVIDEGYRYDIFIKNPQEDMYNVLALCYANETADQICPTIGIFDETSYNLKVGYINKQEGFYKGIQLSGTTSSKRDIKLYVKYFQDEQKQQAIEKFIEVKAE